MAVGASNYGDSAYDGSEDIGQNIGDSFGLGAQRTLTLVNGKRFVAGNSAAGSLGAAVDTNNIPNALIDRVEVKSIGGAAVYGADAIFLKTTMKVLRFLMTTIQFLLILKVVRKHLEV